MKNEIIGMVQSLSHIRNVKDFTINLIITMISFFAGYFQLIVFNNNNDRAFMAIAIVVFADWLFGTWRAVKFKEFQTSKALKVVYYLFAYWTILFTVLSVEKGFPSAFWLTEAIIMPILVFQIISTIKNLILLDIITNSLAKEIFKNIDKHKEQFKINE